MYLPGFVPAAPLFRYRFGTAEFDEARFELRVRGPAGGDPAQAARDPRRLLRPCGRSGDQGRVAGDRLGRPADRRERHRQRRHQAARRAGRGRMRPASSPSRASATASRAVRAHCASGARWVSQLELAAGMPVPGRPNLPARIHDRSLGASEVWLARHGKTHEPRVYKFSPDGGRLPSSNAKRRCPRLLRENLGGTQHSSRRLLDWNFESPPFFLEYEYGGQNLAEWAETDGHLAQLAVPERLDVFLQIVDASRGRSRRRRASQRPEARERAGCARRGPRLAGEAHGLRQQSPARA